VGVTEVRIYSGPDIVATHTEPHTSVVDLAHYRGLWREPSPLPPVDPPRTLEALGRSLADHEAAVAGGAR
ncbi:MAG TPA: IS21 family transposase, partial [Myxococcales bacterium]|nr:IS21 family transposase [Myxococcales bacterium]